MFMDTYNLGEGQDVYHICKNCTYKTKQIETIDSTTMEQIDSSAVDHVWAKHRKIAEKYYLEFRSATIASAPGQQRLEL